MLGGWWRVAQWVVKTAKKRQWTVRKKWTVRTVAQWAGREGGSGGRGEAGVARSREASTLTGWRSGQQKSDRTALCPANLAPTQPLSSSEYLLSVRQRLLQRSNLSSQCTAGDGRSCQPDHAAKMNVCCWTHGTGMCAAEGASLCFGDGRCRSYILVFSTAHE